jgi:hypothetical protein
LTRLSKKILPGLQQPIIPEVDRDFTPDIYDDTYFVVPRDVDGPEYARVTKRLRDKDGLPICVADNNPILDKRMYEVEYPGGHKASLAANVIVENMFAQVDS